MAELSKRMRAVADFVPAGNIAADIGCDHGFVSIFLVERGICPRVFAADVRTGPLMRAKEHIDREGLLSYITPILSDGLTGLLCSFYDSRPLWYGWTSNCVRSPSPV